MEEKRTRGQEEKRRIQFTKVRLDCCIAALANGRAAGRPAASPFSCLFCTSFCTLRPLVSFEHQTLQFDSPAQIGTSISAKMLAGKGTLHGPIRARHVLPEPIRACLLVSLPQAQTHSLPVPQPALTGSLAPPENRTRRAPFGPVYASRQLNQVELWFGRLQDRSQERAHTAQYKHKMDRTGNRRGIH